MKNRNKMLATLLVVVGLAVAGTAQAIYSAFPGNGRGGPLASRPACVDTYRGRGWALYGTPNDGTKSDLLYVCLYNSAGTYAWQYAGVSG